MALYKLDIHPQNNKKMMVAVLVSRETKSQSLRIILTHALYLKLAK